MLSLPGKIATDAPEHRCVFITDSFLSIIDTCGGTNGRRFEIISIFFISNETSIYIFLASRRFKFFYDESSGLMSCSKGLQLASS